MKGTTLVFATCSFTEYDPALMGGVPVQSSNGYPRHIVHTLKYSLKTVLPGGGEIVNKLPLTYPPAETIKWPREKFVPSYLAHLEATGVDAIRSSADELREQLGIEPDVRLVLLCFERLASKAGTYCHRTLFAEWWTKNTSEEVPEYGNVRIAETRAEQEGLF